MASLTPPGDRATLTETAAGFVLNVPAERSLVAQLFLSVWILGWLFGGSAAIDGLRAPGSVDSFAGLVVITWLVGWAIGMVVAVAAWFWLLAGVERVEIDSNGIGIRRQVFGVGRLRRYPAAAVARMRVAELPNRTPSRHAQVRRRRAPQTGLAFDHEGAVVYFGRGIGRAEANRHLDRIRRRFSRYVDSIA